MQFNEMDRPNLKLHSLHVAQVAKRGNQRRLERSKKTVDQST